MKRAALALLFAAALAAAAPGQEEGAASAAAERELRPLWTSGEGGYHTYRIPALITTPQGSVLAFCEGRKAGRGDSGDIDLLMRRSEDGGRTFGPQVVVWNDGPNTCGNPCPVVDRKTGTVWLLMTHNLGVDREHASIAQESQGTRTVWVMRSEDDGRSWEELREITASAKQPDWTWYATGPGVGIQLELGERAGRLVVPCDHIEAGTRRYFSHVIYSDDHGQSWSIGGSSPSDQLNECQVIELTDGRLMLNMRNYDRSQHSRGVCTSADAGQSFSDLRRDSTLIEPICQASLIRYRPASSPGEPLVLFSNPASRDGRVAMTLRLSRDEGESWSASALLHPGPSAYSCLGVAPDGAILCLFEGGQAHPYENIFLTRLDFGELAAEGGDR